MSEGSGRIRCRSWRNQSEKGGKRSLLWKIPLPSYTGRVLVLACLVSAKRSGAEVRSVSRVYHSACLERGQSYWDYENFQLNSVDWEDVDRYEVTGRLGFGRFSEVRDRVVACVSSQGKIHGAVYRILQRDGTRYSVYRNTCWNPTNPQP